MLMSHEGFSIQRGTTNMVIILISHHQIKIIILILNAWVYGAFRS